MKLKPTFTASSEDAKTNRPAHPEALETVHAGGVVAWIDASVVAFGSKKGTGIRENGRAP